MPSFYTFGRMADADIIKLFSALLEVWPDATATMSLGDTASFSLNGSQDAPSQLRALLTSDSYLIQTASFRDPESSTTLVYHRGKTRGMNTQNREAWVPSPSPFIDGIEINSPNIDPKALAPKLLAIVTTHIGLAPPIAITDAGETALHQSASILNGLNAAVRTLVEHTVERQKTLDATRDTLAEKATNKLAEKRSELERQFEHARKELDEREKQLDERAASLDDRENVHVRRELQKQMATLSETRLDKKLLSQSQRAFTLPVALAGVASVAIGWVIYREIGHMDTLGSAISGIVRDQNISPDAKPGLISNVNGQIVYTQIRIALQSIGLALLVWFALRMSSSRYKQVSHWERDLHKFRLDTERAGFLVEGDLEARKVNDEGLPEVLLESFSRGLFSSSEHGAAGDHQGEGVGEALNAMLAQAARVQVGPTGVSVDVDRRGLNKARRLMTQAAQPSGFRCRRRHCR